MIHRSELVSLLRRACDAIRDELSASGPDDVEDHPTLSDHLEIADQIDRFLVGEARRVARVRARELDRRRRAHQSRT